MKACAEVFALFQNACALISHGLAFQAHATLFLQEETESNLERKVHSMPGETVREVKPSKDARHRRSW